MRSESPSRGSLSGSPLHRGGAATLSRERKQCTPCAVFSSPSNSTRGRIYDQKNAAKCDSFQQTKMAQTFENKRRTCAQGEPLWTLWPQAGSAADRRPERTKRGRQPRSRRQPGQGADEFFAASRSRRRLAAKKLVGGEAPPPRPGTGTGKVFLLRRKAQTEHSSEPSPTRASAENALPVREAVPEGEAGGRGRRPKSPAGCRWSPTRSADVKAKPGKEFCLQNDPGCAGPPTSGGEP